MRVGGRADGHLLGGNLSLLAASVGTVDFPDLTGAILLIEDVDEAPYRVDRMLTPCCEPVCCKACRLSR